MPNIGPKAWSDGSYPLTERRNALGSISEALPLEATYQDD
jgi:hypothetical protein